MKVKSNRIDGNLSPEQVYSFNVSGIIGVHTHKIGYGGGIWFRLKDGRVFNKYGKEDNPNPSLYDTVDN
jgi:hypothetical protein